MRQAVRRTVGIGGATAVAIGAALALALPASAHTPTITAACDTETGQAVVTISLGAYSDNKPLKNWVQLDYDGGSLLAQTPFSKTFPETSYRVDGTKAHSFTMTVFAYDDPNGKSHGNGSRQQWDGTFPASSTACVQPKPTETSTTTTTTTTDTSTTTPAPPTTTTGTTAPPSVETTTAAVIAATTTTPGSGSLPFTGVNTALPLGIAGLLVVAGGGILFWLRFNARRRQS
jgi:hypothetical protein